MWQSKCSFTFDLHGLFSSTNFFFFYINVGDHMEKDGDDERLRSYPALVVIQFTTGFMASACTLMRLVVAWELFTLGPMNLLIAVRGSTHRLLRSFERICAVLLKRMDMCLI